MDAIRIKYLIFFTTMAIICFYKLFKQVIKIIFNKAEFGAKYNFICYDNDLQNMIDYENELKMLDSFTHREESDKEILKKSHNNNFNKGQTIEEILKESLDIDFKNSNNLANIINELKTVITTNDVRNIFIETMSTKDSKIISELINNKIHEKILNYVKMMEAKNTVHDEHVKYERNEDIVIFD